MQHRHQAHGLHQDDNIPGWKEVSSTGWTVKWGCQNEESKPLFRNQCKRTRNEKTDSSFWQPSELTATKQLLFLIFLRNISGINQMRIVPRPVIVHQGSMIILSDRTRWIWCAVLGTGAARGAVVRSPPLSGESFFEFILIKYLIANKNRLGLIFHQEAGFITIGWFLPHKTKHAWRSIMQCRSAYFRATDT